MRTDEERAKNDPTWGIARIGFLAARAMSRELDDHEIDYKFSEIIRLADAVHLTMGGLR